MFVCSVKNVYLQKQSFSISSPSIFLKCRNRFWSKPRSETDFDSFSLLIQRGKNEVCFHRPTAAQRTDLCHFQDWPVPLLGPAAPAVVRSRAVAQHSFPTPLMERSSHTMDLQICFLRNTTATLSKSVTLYMWMKAGSGHV